MANEATITCGLSILSGNLDYQSRPRSFRANVTGSKGPTPGALTALTTGTLVDFSQLDLPGYCVITNLDTVNLVTVGIYDPEVGNFYPFMEILPGESYPLRWSRYVEQEITPSTGTATIGPTTNRVMIKASETPCDVIVAAFES